MNFHPLSMSLLTGAAMLFLAACDSRPPAWWAEGQDPEKINTSGWEDSPFLSGDGQRLYFMYTPYNMFPFFHGKPLLKVGPGRPGHHSSVDGNPWMDADTYVSTLQPDGSWGVPEHLPLNGGFTDSCGMPSRDGRAFYYLTRTIGGPENPTIHKVEADLKGTWGEPRDIGVSLIEPQEGHPCTNPHISADENTIWFSSKRPGGQGSLDLWMSQRGTNGTWGEPVNLGPEINSAEDEDQAWVSVDNELLFFNRGMVIYESKFLNGAWQTPREVVLPGTRMAAEVSLTDDLQTMCIAVPDLDRQDVTISISRRQPDGSWGEPVAVD